MARKTSHTRSTEAAPKLGRTLKRFLGLIACGGLVSASIWINTQTSAQDPEASSNPFERYRANSSAASGKSARAAKPSDVNRRRVEDQMRLARQALRSGKSEEAARLATVADNMARQFKVEFQADEQTPTELLALIQGPESAEDTQFASQYPGGRSVQQASASDDPHAFVQTLLTEAREDIRRGELDIAKQKIEQASATEVEYGNFDIRPEHVMAELAKKQAASPDGPTDTFAKIQRNPQAGWADSEAPAPEGQPAEAGLPDLKAQATELVALARESLEKGHLDEARAFAMEAQKLDVQYGVLDSKPEHVLAEIERRSKTVVITKRGGGKVSPAASSDENVASKEAALKLLAEARQDMEAGDLKSAKAKTDKAQQIDVAYGIFDDRPDLVAQDIRSAESKASIAATRQTGNRNVAVSADKEQALKLLAGARSALKSGNVQQAQKLVSQAEQIDVAYDTFDDRPEIVREDIERLVAGQPGAAPTGPASDLSLEDQKLAAQSLLKEARQAMETGNVRVAQAKAQQAAQYDVAYDLFEDTPERVLAEVEKLGGGSVAARPRQGADVATAGTAFEETPVLEGSARELYDQGVDALRHGDRQQAYQAFLAAHNTGEKLDRYRQQQLQDKLRELAPRNQIQQVNGEQLVEGGEDTSRLDAAAQEQDAKFDKLRTETLNVVFRAGHLKERKPDQAKKLLEDQLAAIDASGFSPEQVDPLAGTVRSGLSDVESYMKQRAPVLEMERKNAETRELVEREIQTRVRVEQEMATLVEKFNDLKEQRRFAEAHAVAKQALELDPNNAVAVQMELNAQFAMRTDEIDRLKKNKEVSFYEGLQEVEESAVNELAIKGDSIFYNAKKWDDIRNRKAAPTTGEEKSAVEERIYTALKSPVSLHFDNTPLQDVLQHIADNQGIAVVVDAEGLNEEGNTSSTPVTISVDGIRLESALNLMLKQLHLDYVVENEVLNITSASRRQGDMKPIVYQVADLVTPLTSMRNPSSSMQPGTGYGSNGGGGMFSVGFGGLGQVAADGANPLLANSAPQGLEGEQGVARHDFRALSDLIMTTVDPDSWEDNGGQASISNHPSTLSLVIRQTQKVHQEIGDLLNQLRRLQDLQVTIEVRYITISDKFFEQIGVDFDFNVNDTIGGPTTNSSFNPLRPFGHVDPVNGTAGGAGQTGTQNGGQGGQNQNGGQAGQNNAATGIVGGSSPFAPGPRLNMVGRDRWPARTVVGMSAPGQFSGDLDVPFRQGSFDLATPTFGNFDPAAGVQFGMAILSDIEAFLFVRAAQGDRRSNIMFAPKVTTFNGILASVSSGQRRPFVTGLTPVASAFSIGFSPQITQIFEGASLDVLPVVSADRRYVRLAVAPNFSNITDVQTFSFAGGSAGGLTGQGALGGGAGGLGGIGGGGGGGIGGGIGGGVGGGVGGQGGQGQNQAGGSGQSAAVQQPIQAVTTVSTVVSVPDGGTVLLGGLKSLSEGRNMAGVPILNKIPYISRLFRNTGVGRETTSLMLMVTPRIIIQEEEEQLLGLPE